MKTKRDKEDRSRYEGIKEKDRNYNLNLYGEMLPPLYSWMTPEEQRRRTEDINNMMDKRDINDGKATDVDMGFRNNGLK